MNCSLLAECDMDACGRILYDSFSNDTYSWSAAVGYPFAELDQWFRTVYLPHRATCSSTPSLVCSTTESHQIIGVCCIEDYYSPPPEPQPSHPAILEMAEACNRLLRTVKDLHTLRVAYLSFIAVDPMFRRKKVADYLLTEACILLQKKGYHAVIACCTSYRSRALFEKHGYNYVDGICYQEFRMPDGSAPFQSMPHDECSVMLKFLSFDYK